jgi:hypothetical protein
MLYDLITSSTKEGIDDTTTSSQIMLPVPIAPSDFNYSLSSYYILTASDCCLNADNTFVSLDSLKNVIAKGARCLDFQIFSIDNNPCVSYSSSTDNYNWVNIRNYISFRDVMKTITTYAFQEATCSNFSDPLLIHLRVKSANSTMFSNLTSIFSSYVNYMLNSQLNYTTNNPIDIPGMTLPTLRNKIIIIIDNTFPDVLEHKPIMEYVNIVSNKSFCQTMSFDQYKNTPDINQLIDFNKTGLCMVLPNISTGITPYPVSIDLSITNQGGVQMSGISFQNNNPNDYKFFTDAKYAYVLKPESLRSTPPPTYAPTDQPIDPIPKTTMVQGGLSITI